MKSRNYIQHKMKLKEPGLFRPAKQWLIVDRFFSSKHKWENHEEEMYLTTNQRCLETIRT